jgi:GNAT superfamily N-acetyltransferase
MESSHTCEKAGFTISTDRSLLDIPYIHRFLTNSYWSPGIPFETVEKAIQGSLCFGIYAGQRQVGFGRLITDKATFAYLADVFVDEEYRGKGLGKWLMEVIMSQDFVPGLRRMMLGTRDAQGLYAQFGFTELSANVRWMQLHRPDVYQTPS